VYICSTVDLHRPQQDSQPLRGLPHGLQGNLCSGIWIAFSLSFFIDLGVCRVVLSYILTPLSGCCCAGVFSLLKYITTEAIPLSLIASALASGGSIFELAGIGFIRHRESF